MNKNVILADVTLRSGLGKKSWQPPLMVWARVQCWVAAQAVAGQVRRLAPCTVCLGCVFCPRHFGCVFL